MIDGDTLKAFSNTYLTAASLPPMYLLKMSEPLTEKNFMGNSSSTDDPKAVFPFPVAPYRRIPLGTLIFTLS
jgi:hypothetical protein